MRTSPCERCQLVKQRTIAKKDEARAQNNVANQGVIKKAIADIYNDPTMSLSTLNDRARYQASVNPSTATPSDAYTFLEEFDETFEQ